VAATLLAPNGHQRLTPAMEAALKTIPLNHFPRAIKANPKYSIARFNLAVAYQRQGRHEMAIPELERVVALEPGHAATYRKLASSYERVGRLDDARIATEKLRRLEEAIHGPTPVNPAEGE